MHAQLFQLCLILCDPMDWSQPGSSVHGILWTRILEWVVMPSSRGSTWPRAWTSVSCISCITGRFFTTELLRKPSYITYSSVNNIYHVAHYVPGSYVSITATFYLLTASSNSPRAIAQLILKISILRSCVQRNPFWLCWLHQIPECLFLKHENMLWISFIEYRLSNVRSAF